MSATPRGKSRIDSEFGCWMPGTQSDIKHLGEPLSADQIRALAEGAEVTVTWSGGNGPWPYRIVVDETTDARCADNGYRDPLLASHRQIRPSHRVTLGWDDAAREHRRTRDGE